MGHFATCEINVKKLADNVKLPTRGSAAAAGYDLYSAAGEDVTVQPHQTVKISTGLAMEIPEGFFGAVFARSGMATKRGLRPENCVGIIDSDYRGPIIVAIHNDTNLPQTIEKDERIAQLIIIPYLPIDFNEVAELNETERGNGGFGSTGTK